MGVSGSGLWVHLHFSSPFSSSSVKAEETVGKKMLYETCWKWVELEMMLTRGLEIQNREDSDQI